MLTLTIILLIGCEEEASYEVWVEASQGPELINNAKERLTNAKIDFIIDDDGSLLVKEKDFDKAIMCCS